MAEPEVVVSSAFIDPESILEKSEIVNVKNRPSSTTIPPNSEIIHIDDESSDDEIQAEIPEPEIEHDSGESSYQTEFEKLIHKTDIQLQVLKEVVHDDKENRNSHKGFGECVKKPRGRPSTKENKTKIRNVRTPSNEEGIEEPTTTLSKPFNITLGFLGRAKKIKSPRYKIKSSKNSTTNALMNVLSMGSVRKRMRRNGKKLVKRLHTVETQTETQVYAETKTEGNELNETNNSSYDNNNVIEIIDSDDEIVPDQEIILPELYSENAATALPLKRKRGRPARTVKIKKPSGQIGRPLLIEPNELYPRQVVARTPGKRGRPAGPPKPPKPPKIPGKRGRKPKINSGAVQKSKVPGRGRGRPSFQSLGMVARRSQKLPNAPPGKRGRPSLKSLKALTDIDDEKMDEEPTSNKIVLEEMESENETIMNDPLDQADIIDETASVRSLHESIYSSTDEETNVTKNYYNNGIDEDTEDEEVIELALPDEENLFIA